MSQNNETNPEKIFAFAQCLSRAELLRNLFKGEMDNKPDPTVETAAREHEWRWFGLMSYWYASLYVVIEAWDEMRFRDPIIDRLLAHPNDFRRLLKRYRNSVFHCHRTILDGRVRDLFDHGATHVWWITALHQELVRGFADYLDHLLPAADQKDYMRNCIESIVHWYPYREDPAFDSLEIALRNGRRLIAETPDDHSGARRDLQSSLDSIEIELRKARDNWEIYRARLLHAAGTQTDRNA